MNRIDLDGRVAVITGGSGGIGLATARRMLASGAAVSIWDIDEVALARATAELPALHTVAVDLLDEAATEAAVAATAAVFGRIDILVNAVGLEGVRAAVHEHDLAAWRRILAVNLDAPFIASKHVVREMLKRDYGRVVHLSSTAGKDGNPMGAAYSTAKAGIMALTKSMGKELAATGIRVNAVSPAAIEGALFHRSSPDGPNRAIARIPMGRLGREEEVAALILWLSSEDCSFSTGAVFDVSGGRSTY
ncbi:SDR family NAD(P)-dependent oxidoreductase [Azospirillum endophyticum]